MVKKILIAGGSGVISRLILEQCLESKEIEQVISFVCKKSVLRHPKLKEIVLTKLADCATHANDLSNIDTVFFSTDLYTGQMSNEQLKIITVDYSNVLGEVLRTYSPNARFCLLSGGGITNNMALSKYRSIVENNLIRLRFGDLYIFRPDHIYPVCLPNTPSSRYGRSRSIHSLIRLNGKNGGIKSTELAKSIFNVGLYGYHSEILENKDIVDVLG